MSALDRFKYQPNATRKPQQAAKVKKEPHAKPRAPGRKRRTRAFAAATTSTTPKLEPDRKRQHRTTAAAAAAAVAASGAPAATSKTTVKHEDVPLPFVGKLSVVPTSYHVASHNTCIWVVGGSCAFRESLPGSILKHLRGLL